MRVQFYDAVLVRTHQGGYFSELTPRENWKDFDEALQRYMLAAEAETEVDGLLDFVDGWGLFRVDSEFGRRALKDKYGSFGIAVAGNALFSDKHKEDALAFRAKYLQRAGVDSEKFDLNRPCYLFAWTFFEMR